MPTLPQPPPPAGRALRPGAPVTDKQYRLLSRSLRGWFVPSDNLPWPRMLTPAEWDELLECVRHFRYYGQEGEPVEPTAERPGSDEKKAVLTERRRCGLSLHHPRDVGATAAEQTCRRVVRQLVTLAEEAREERLAEIHRRLKEKKEATA